MWIRKERTVITKGWIWGWGRQWEKEIPIQYEKIITSDGRYGRLNLGGNQIPFPKEFIGKKVRIYLEVVEDE